MSPWDCPWITGWLAQIVVSAVEETGPAPASCVSDGDLFVGNPDWSSQDLCLPVTQLPVDLLV